jgi:membrane protease YdiL (CAAX protease family)
MTTSSPDEMLFEGGSLAKWSWGRLLLLGGSVCIINLIFSIAGSLAAPRIVMTVPSLDLVIRSSTVLLELASIVPGVALLAGSKECRAALLRFEPQTGVYVTAVVVGFALPFSSYLGAGYAPSLPWVSMIGKVFLINIFLTPLWEEIIWRGYFYRGVGSMLRTKSAIVVASAGWTVWHAGFLYFLHRGGVRPAILAIFVVQIFLIGTILCSFFTLGRGALLPCVLFHTAFDASIWTYTASGHPVNDIGAIVAETLFVLIVATIMFRTALRRTERFLPRPFL